MSKEVRYSRGERIGLFCFATSFTLYLVNILLGKASILWGWKLFYLGNVGEFLLLLLASITLIAAALHREMSEEAEAKEIEES